MKFSFDTFLTPLGEFSLAVDPDGAVAATAFGGRAALCSRIRADGLRQDSAPAREARREIEEYFAGERRVFTIRLNARGTDFQQAVWSVLRQIPFGETRTYGELASRLGKPGAARAIGRANATNPICLIVPCHRVIGADGSLTGFAFGEATKRQLLALESRHVLVPAGAG